MKISIASRQSDLARLQAFEVAKALKNHNSEIEVEFKFSKSAGDKDLDSLLSSFGDKGAFTQDFYKGLVDGEHDVVVHSWKDLPIEVRPGAKVVATLPREDVRDLVLFKKSVITTKPKQVCVLSSSPRRIYNLQSFLKNHLPFEVSEVSFKPVRGNIETRISKLVESTEAHAIVVAKAAIDRLLTTDVDELQPQRQRLSKMLESLTWMVMPLSVNPAAPAQGALAVEINENRSDLMQIFESINSKNDFENVNEERETLKKYGGGCHQKIGVSVLTKAFGNLKYLRGLTEQGEVLNSDSWVPAVKNPSKPSVQESFPVENPLSQFFQRNELALSTGDLAKVKNAKALRVARANAVTDLVLPELTGKVVWTSGVASWEKLAKRGVWVNGCDDNLGELEDPQLTAMLGPVEWLKLTHDQSTNSDFPSLPTYTLNRKEDVPNLSGKKAFYWMSGTSYLRAIKSYPEVASGLHFCGPGNTHKELQKHLKTNENLFVFPSYNIWKQWLSSNKER